MPKELPAEVLLKIFRATEERDIRQCLLVNKFWSRIARMIIGKSIHLVLTKRSRLYNDLLRFPLLAQRVTILTIKSNDTTHATLIISLCANITNLSFYRCRPTQLLDLLLQSEITLLPRIEQVSAGPANYDLTDILWPFMWEHRATIKKISVWGKNPFVKQHAQDLPEFISHFPQLEELDALAFSETNLHDLLSSGKNLKKISLEKSTVYYDHKDVPDANLSTKLEEFTLFGFVRKCVPLFLAEVTANDLKKSKFPDGSVRVKQEHDELYSDILKHFVEVKPYIFIWKRDLAN